jgi:hypothetical protein
MGEACSTYGRQDRCIQGFDGGDLREGDHFEDPGVDGRTILKWIFKKWDVETWTGLIWLRIGIGGGRCECVNKPSGSIKYREFLD